MTAGIFLAWMRIFPVNCSDQVDVADEGPSGGNAQSLVVCGNVASQPMPSYTRDVGLYWNVVKLLFLMSFFFSTLVHERNNCSITAFF